MSDGLVIGYEERPEGNDAVALGAELCRAFGLEPLLAHVVAVPAGVLSNPELEATLRAVGASVFEKPSRRLASLDAGTEVVVSTSAARALSELAAERSAHAIVVGSTERGALGRVLVGSTARRLLSGAPCAVAVAARGFADQGRQLLRIAAAYDGSPEAEAAVRAAIAVARNCNSTLTLLSAAHTNLAIAAAPTPVPIADYEPTRRKQMEELLDRARSRVPGALPVATQLLHGAPGEVLAEVSSDYDLLVVGSRSYGPLRTTLLGSTSRHLFDHAACSILAMPRGAPEPTSR